MNVRTIALSPAANDCDPARIFAAIELSKKSWMVAVQTPLSDKIGVHTLPAGDGAALLKLLARARRRDHDPDRI